jgi:hypothetical protein
MVDGTGDGVVRIDIGAYESQGVPHFSPGDYTRDGVVNACDYLLWRDTLGSHVAPFSGADGNGNGLIDGDDYTVWLSHFGAGLVFTLGSGGSAGFAATEPSAPAPSSGASLVFVSQPPASPGVDSHPTARRAKSAPTADAARDDALVAWLAGRPHDATTHSHFDDSPVDGCEGGDGDAIDEAIDAAFAAIGV